MTTLVAWIALATALIGLLTKLLELRAAAAKNRKDGRQVSSAEKLAADRLTTSQAASSTIAALKKKIDRQWTKVSAFCAVAFVVFILTLAWSSHPDVSEIWQWIGMGVGEILAVAYLGIAFVEGRTAVRLHEEKGRLEVIEAIPEALTRWVELKRKEEKPNQAPEPTPMAVTPPAAQEPRQP